MALSSKKKFDKEQLVEAVQPVAVTVEGIDYIFNPGRQRIRASHPAVVSNPELFQAIDDRPQSET